LGRKQIAQIYMQRGLRISNLQVLVIRNLTNIIPFQVRKINNWLLEIGMHSYVRIYISYNLVGQIIEIGLKKDYRDCREEFSFSLTNEI
jgi:hypothetical protein